jgi:hypothetical protein
LSALYALPRAPLSAAISAYSSVNGVSKYCAMNQLREAEGSGVLTTSVATSSLPVACACTFRSYAERSAPYKLKHVLNSKRVSSDALPAMPTHSTQPEDIRISASQQSQAAKTPTSEH